MEGSYLFAVVEYLEELTEGAKLHFSTLTTASVEKLGHKSSSSNRAGMEISSMTISDAKNIPQLISSSPVSSGVWTPSPQGPTALS